VKVVHIYAYVYYIHKHILILISDKLLVRSTKTLSIPKEGLHVESLKVEPQYKFIFALHIYSSSEMVCHNICYIVTVTTFSIEYQYFCSEQWMQGFLLPTTVTTCCYTSISMQSYIATMDWKQIILYPSRQCYIDFIEVCLWQLEEFSLVRDWHFLYKLLNYSHSAKRV